MLPVGDNGFRFRTRTESDAKAYVAEWSQRDRTGRRTRLELVAILVIAVVTLATWGIVALVG